MHEQNLDTPVIERLVRDAAAGDGWARERLVERWRGVPYLAKSVLRQGSS